MSVRLRDLKGADCRASLLDLPLEVLEIICEALKTDQRVWLLSCCRTLYSLSQQHLPFFHSIDLRLYSPRHARHARRWLRGKAAALQRLSLFESLAKTGYHKLPPIDSGVGSSSAASEPWTVMAELVGAAPNLTSLSWELRVPRIFNESAVELGDLQLPALRSLALSGNRDLLLILGGDVSRLQALQALSLGPYCSLGLRRGCLPRGVARLEVNGWESAWMDAPLRSLRKLRTLRYTAPTSPVGLRRLTALTSLALAVHDWGHGVLRQLAALTGLRCLSLQGVLELDSPAEWDALLPLTRLSTLALRECGSTEACMARLQEMPALRKFALELATEEDSLCLCSLTQLATLGLRMAMEEWVPACVWTLEALKDLDVSLSYLEEPPLLLAPSQQLTRLSLNLRQAAHLSSHLQQLDHLRILSLHGSPEVQLSRLERRQLLHVLCSLPRLRQLRLAGALSKEVWDALGEVPRWAAIMDGRHVELVRLGARDWEG